jgi:hypothetical protein
MLCPYQWLYLHLSISYLSIYLSSIFYLYFYPSIYFIYLSFYLLSTHLSSIYLSSLYLSSIFMSTGLEHSHKTDKITVEKWISLYVYWWVKRNQVNFTGIKWLSLFCIVIKWQKCLGTEVYLILVYTSCTTSTFFLEDHDYCLLKHALYIIYT